MNQPHLHRHHIWMIIPKDDMLTHTYTTKKVYAHSYRVTFSPCSGFEFNKTRVAADVMCSILVWKKLLVKTVFVKHWSF